MDRLVKDWRSHRLPDSLIPRKVSRGGRERWSEVNRAHLVVGPRQRPRIPRAIRSFVEGYRPKALLMVQAGLSHLQREGETEVRWLPAGEVTGALQEYLG